MGNLDPVKKPYCQIQASNKEIKAHCNVNTIAL